MNLEDKDIIRLSRQTGKTKFYTKDIMKNSEEIQKYLDDHNITFEEYMRANMITEKTGVKNFGYTPDFSNDFFTIRSYYWGGR